MRRLVRRLRGFLGRNWIKCLEDQLQNRKTFLSPSTPGIKKMRPARILQRAPNVSSDSNSPLRIELIASISKKRPDEKRTKEKTAKPILCGHVIFLPFFIHAVLKLYDSRELLRSGS